MLTLTEPLFLNCSKKDFLLNSCPNKKVYGQVKLNSLRRREKKIFSNLNMRALREKCPNTEFFLVRIFLYSDWIQENTDHKKLRIWTLFTQWWHNSQQNLLETSKTSFLRKGGDFYLQKK